jgi:hypothetical protein
METMPQKCTRRKSKKSKTKIRFDIYGLLCLLLDRSAAEIMSLRLKMLKLPQYRSFKERMILTRIDVGPAKAVCTNWCSMRLKNHHAFDPPFWNGHGMTW